MKQRLTLKRKLGRRNKRWLSKKGERANSQKYTNRLTGGNRNAIKKFHILEN